MLQLLAPALHPRLRTGERDADSRENKNWKSACGIKLTVLTQNIVVTSSRTSTSTGIKKRILEASEAILLVQGFNGTGINDILQAVGMPKGSFYHWFPSKEQFGVELLQHYGQKMLDYRRKWRSKRDMIPNG